MKSYRIGRGEHVDILVDESSVGRYHADLVLTKDGGYLWIDRQSANGSYRRKNSQWVPLIKDVVAADEPIRLGRVETTVAALLEKAGLKKFERDSFGMPVTKR